MFPLLLLLISFRFVKIRYGGFMAGGYKKKLLTIALGFLEKISAKFKEITIKLTTLAENILSKHQAICPKCKKGQFLYYFNVPPDQLYKFIPNGSQ